MRKYLFLPLVVYAQLVGAQQLQKLTLTEAYDLSQKNYPVIRQKELVRRTAAISISNLSTGFLPQLTLSGQATYQSDVTKVPISLPGMNIESPARDQYKVVADVSQLLYDGGLTRQQKELQRLNAEVEDQKVEVELYKLKERINQIYLGILYLDEQFKQVELVKSDIQTGIRRLEAQVQNGVAFKSNLNMLKAEMLKTEQRAIEIQSSRKGWMATLSLFLGQSLSDSAHLETPLASAVAEGSISRPEMKLYSDQEKLAGQQKKLISARNLPKASVFAQGGYGRPGLNMLMNDFDFYYIGGIRFNWSLGSLYTKKKDKEQVEVNKRVVNIQKETFVLNTEAQLKQQQSEIDKLSALVNSDAAIIELRHSVTDAAKAQLENGVITANDYLKEVNAEDQARQTLITHQVQLLQAKINYLTYAGKQ